MKKRKIVSGILLPFAALLLVILLGSSMVVTRQDEYKIIREFGKIVKIVNTAGLSFKVPFIQSTQSLPKNVQLYDLPISDVITKDKKTMVCDSFVLWRITDVQKFVRSLNGQVGNAESRINTIVYNSIKNVISSMAQADVISGRDGELSEAIQRNIGATPEQYGIELTAVETKHLDLPDANKTAVYERMISERNNIAAQYEAEGNSEAKKIKTDTDTSIEVKVSEAEAQAEKIIAEGESEYMKILSKAYNSKDKADFYTFVRSLDAAKATMTGDNKTLILSKDSPITQIFTTIE
ncbi:protease modulator HflC [Acetivibrio ethanolgignens]|uniref:Protein HflC n=1 Tax=Acetivibrio ethanolgignens TaxID=290052 RepID=A0A0V8QCL6_9FIRM|nr:protease modulator HflC [Acetivibrio ethanolgignens]KSV58351.1 protease modulator HflC [Acetivibrio ethanolgignens]